MLRYLPILLSVLAVGCAAEYPAEEQSSTESELQQSSRDEVVDAAREDRLVGEQATGFLGVVDPDSASRDLRARVSQINIKRRALYTEVAGKNHVTVSVVAQVMACTLFRDRVRAGEMYRTEDERWLLRATASATAIEMPSFCQD